MSFRVQDSPENRLLTWWFQAAAELTGLKTVAGEQLILLEAGVRNDGPGPDIKDAVIALDGRITSGAVEIHQVPGDWFSHGHDGDAAYNDVILHVVSRPGQGPDLPTLVVPYAEATGWCRAQRTLQADELYLAAADRYRYKLNKVQHWQACTTTTWSVIRLGLLDCMALGPSRQTHWQSIQRRLYLPQNPIGTAWQGSFQSRLLPDRQRRRIDKLIRALPAVTHPDLSGSDWRAWEAWWQPYFRAWQIPLTLLREWLINWVVPATYSDIIAGLKIWQELPPARHYGLERKVKRFTGWERVQTAFEQQGLLFWWQKGCSARQCQVCPLTRHTVSENLSNTLYDKRLANSSLVNYERIA